MPRTLLLFTLFALLCAVSPTKAQTQSDDVVRITTNLVQIDAVVTKKGKPVKDLKPEDFEIFEDGKRQTITSFAYVSNVGETSPSSGTTATGAVPGAPVDPSAPPAAPPVPVNRRIIALVVDDYGLSAQSMSAVRTQVRKFIDQKLTPRDLIAIIRTSRGRREVPQFTNDKGRLNQAWEELKWNQCSRVGVKTMPRVGAESSGGCGGAASFDESINSIRAIVRALREIPGRKSMIIFSDDTPLRENEKLTNSTSVLAPDSKSEEAHSYLGRLRRLAELAIRSSVVIYGVDTGGLQTTGVTAADATIRPNIAGPAGNGVFTGQLRGQSKLIDSRRDSANVLAKETGGFLVRDQNEFQFDQILEDQSGYYLIGYRPSTETFDKRFHKFRARVNKAGYEVRTRSGFFGMTEEDAKRLKD